MQGREAWAISQFSLRATSARNVATTVSGPKKAEFVQSLGAELAIDYTRQNFVEAIMNWTRGLGVRPRDRYGGGRDVLQVFCRRPAVRAGRNTSLDSCDNRDIEYCAAAQPDDRLCADGRPTLFGLQPARLKQTRILERGAELFEKGVLKVSHQPCAAPGKSRRRAPADRNRPYHRKDRTADCLSKECTAQLIGS